MSSLCARTCFMLNLSTIPACIYTHMGRGVEEIGVLLIRILFGGQKHLKIIAGAQTLNP